ncbi:MAG: phosphoglycerate mutase family protein [Anaerolineae bacterium]|nr:phosphoglycerate mutase family protein [Anaerolineae bacterium]
MVAQRTLYLVRHGQYDMAVRTPDGGSLTAIGRQQAEYVAKAIKEFPITSITASTMVRAIETGNIIAQATEKPYAVSDLLREGIPSIPPRFATELLEMMENDPRLTHESIHADGQRANEAFAHFFCTLYNR